MFIIASGYTAYYTAWTHRVALLYSFFNLWCNSHFWHLASAWKLETSILRITECIWLFVVFLLSLFLLTLLPRLSLIHQFDSKKVNRKDVFTVTSRAACRASVELCQTASASSDRLLGSVSWHRPLCLFTQTSPLLRFNLHSTRGLSYSIKVALTGLCCCRVCVKVTDLYIP